MSLERVREVGRLLEASAGADPETIIQSALQATPDDPDLRAHYAVFLHRQGRTAEAETVLQHPDELTRYTGQLALARLLLANGDTDSARSLFRRAASQGIPKEPLHLVEAGELANQLGLKDLAEEIFEKALRFELSGADLQRIADVARRFDPPHLAARIYGEYARRYPEHAPFQIMAGSLTLRLGNRAQGYRHFSDALKTVEAGDPILRVVLEKLLEAALTGTVTPQDSEILDLLSKKFGDVFHPRTIDMVHRVAAKAALFNAAVAGLDAPPADMDQCLAQARLRLEPFHADLQRLLGTAPGVPDPQVLRMTSLIQALGTDPKTDVAVWTACLAFAREHEGHEALGGGDVRPPALILAGMTLCLQRRHREALLCLVQGLTQGPRPWLALWSAAICASRLGFADLSLAFVRAVQKLCPDFVYAANVWKHPLGYYAQDEQDIALDAFFDLFPARHRTFVEVGAFDPRLISNSRRLLENGWHGLMVEPSPSAIARLRADGHPNATLVEVAASNVQGTFTLYEPQWPGLESGGGTSMLGHLKPGAVDQDPFGPLHGTPTLAFGKTAASVVRSRRLDDILAEHWPQNIGIDLLCIDVETAEPLVFQGFDLERYKPRLILLETATRAIESRLFAAGYRLILVGKGDGYYALI